MELTGSRFRASLPVWPLLCQGEQGYGRDGIVWLGMEMKIPVRAYRAANLLLVFPVAIFAGCSNPNGTQCRSATTNELSEAQALIGDNWDSTTKPSQREGFFATNEVMNSKACDGTVIVTFAPKADEGIVGSISRFTVDLKTRTVEKEYLD
jgi:hypothetical protein